MKTLAIIILTVIVLSSCHHSTTPAPVTTPPPSTTTSSTITPYVGTWYLDTVKVVRSFPGTSGNYTCTVCYTTNNPIYYWGLTSGTGGTTCISTSVSTYSTSYFGVLVDVEDTAYTSHNTIPNGVYYLNIDVSSKVTIFDWLTEHWCWGIGSGYLYAGGSPNFKIVREDSHNFALIYCGSGSGCVMSSVNYYYHFHK